MVQRKKFCVGWIEVRLSPPDLRRWLDFPHAKGRHHGLTGSYQTAHPADRGGMEG